MKDEVFSVYAAIAELNERLKTVEEKQPDYTADMLEVYRNIGVVVKRVETLEAKLKEITG